MLFKVHHDKDFKEINPSHEAIPNLERLTSKQLMFVALVADAESPLRTLPDKKRREEAAKLAGYPLEADNKRLDKNGRNLVDGKVPTVEIGITTYKDLQYDEQRAMLDAVDAQIQRAIHLIQSDHEELCMVKKVTTTKDGAVSEETKTDGVMLFKLAKESNDLAKSLPTLRESKTALLEKIKKDEDVNLPDLVTPDEISDETTLSTLDQVMSKKTEE